MDELYLYVRTNLENIEMNTYLAKITVLISGKISDWGKIPFH